MTPLNDRIALILGRAIIRAEENQLRYEQAQVALDALVTPEPDTAPNSKEKNAKQG